MLARIFEGVVQKVELDLNQWLEDVKPVIKNTTATMGTDPHSHIKRPANDWMTLVVFYDQRRKQQERVRGPEKPGEPPLCSCGSKMVRRERKADGQPFWGCSKFPECKGIVSFDEDDKEAERKKTSPDEPEFGGKGGYYDDSSDDVPF